MAHIERRVRNGKTTYRARYRDPAGREHAKVFARKADAQRFLTEMENSKLKGTWTDPALGRVLFRDWLGEWWATTTNLRPTTRERNETLLRRYALPRFGDLALVAISQRDVRAWVAELNGLGLAPATVQKAYQLLGKVMGAAVDAGMVMQTPCRRVPLPRVEREEMRFLTPAEIARLADVIDPRYRVLVLVAAYGGLRIGELAGCAADVLICSGERLKSPRSSPRPGVCCGLGRPRPGPVGGRSRCPARSLRSWPRIWSEPSRRPSSSPPPRVGRCGSTGSGLGCGGRRLGGPTWPACAFTTCGTRRWPCGSPSAPVPRRSRPGPAIPR
jgi:Phage integrase, N-terminal SAM-like domain